MKEELIDVIEGWQGIKEHQEIIDLYNSYLPHPRGHKLTAKDAWCAATISAASIKLGYTDTIPVECGAWELFRDCQKTGSITHNPKRGDIILMKPSGYHIGVVEYVEEGNVCYIAGNDGGTVRKVVKDINDPVIVSYVSPNYQEQPISIDFEVWSNEIKLGSWPYEICKAMVDSQLVIKQEGKQVYPEPIVTAQYHPTTLLNLRTEPGGKIVKILKKSDICTHDGKIIKYNGTDWYHLTIDDKEGYASSKYLVRV